MSIFLYATDNVLAYKDEMIKIMAKVVKATDEILFTQFGQSKEDITFFVSMTDDDMAEELENQSVIQMTNAKLVDGFLRRYQ
ncbi:DUF4303 domain-containing protein [Paenibacillus sp. CMAA1739]|nr:DUF4303 domain-containing protein [Paenibacillus ottowii]MDP1512749.1 DUF4303 domain-containing protein [Paenibacillus ottowii]MEC4568772.1 DUF4303 domain-containing protein [Paenibacillus sp. CMAA1739]